MICAVPMATFGPTYILHSLHKHWYFSYKLSWVFPFSVTWYYILYFLYIGYISKFLVSTFPFIIVKWHRCIDSLCAVVATFIFSKLISWTKLRPKGLQPSHFLLEIQCSSREVATVYHDRNQTAYSCGSVVNGCKDLCCLCISKFCL